MYYVVTLNPKDPISMKEKKEYVNSLNGTRDKLGTIEKFCRAIQTSIPIEKSKYSILDATLATPLQNSVAKFYFNESEKVFAHSWAKFLFKVYPDLEVCFHKTDVRYSKLDYVLSYLFSDMKDTPVCLEISLSEKLTKREIKQVESLVEEMKSEDLYYVCRQFECDTCKEHNPNNPIHFELDNHYKAHYIKKQKDNPNSELETCDTCKELLYEGECEICNYPYEFKF